MGTAVQILDRAVSANPLLPRLDAHAGCQIEDTDQTRVQDDTRTTLYFEIGALILF